MMRWPFRLIIAGTAVTLLAAGAARAEIREPTPAENLLREILEYISEKISKAEVGARLEMGAATSASAVGESVKMKFPAPRIVSADGSWLLSEDTAARVTPIGGEAFEFSVDLPHTLSLSDGTGQPEERINWQGGALSGVWRADLETFPVFHGNIHDVVLTDRSQTPEHEDGTIETITIDQDLGELTPGLWSGPSVFKMTNLEVHPAGETETLSIEQLLLTNDARDFDLPAWQALSTMMGAEQILNEEGEFSADDQQIGQAAKIFAAMHAGAEKAAFTLTGLRFGTQLENQFSLQKMTLDMGYDNDAQPGEYSFALTLSGLEQAEIDVPPEFYPHFAALKLHVERLPMRQILTIPLREPAPVADSEAGQYGDALQQFLLPLIYANRTVVEFEDITLRSAATTLMARGRITAEETSALGVVGSAEIEVTGLDNLIAEAARQAENGEDAPELLAMLTLAKGLGRPEINAEGELAYMFDILLSPNGEITINEIPLDLLQDSGLTSLPTPRKQLARASIHKKF